MVVCMVERMANLMATTKVMECEHWNEAQQYEYVVLHKMKTFHKKRNHLG
jgi:hypothetical protein